VDVSAAARAIKRGEIVGVPTDTVYGLAADPYDEAALDRLYDIKGREPGKPIAILVADLDQGLLLGAMSDRALDLAERHWPGAVTLVVPRLDTAPTWLGDIKRRTIALRCPDHSVALDLLRLTGPLAVTSANRSTSQPVNSSTDARSLFADEVLTYLPGDAGGGEPSTLVDLTHPSEMVLRTGPVAL
jgi:tRNA threonylcarbamoyl adenosine modification protein (Sua5/YciO/YrdC/YwlC family)